MISKELLSAVLNSDIYLKEGYGEYFSQNPNTYELAHECKEWAWKNGFMLVSYKYFADKSCNEIDGWVCHLKIENANRCPECSELEDVKWFPAMKTEPEAIFEACQWILNNKEINGRHIKTVHIQW